MAISQQLVAMLDGLIASASSAAAHLRDTLEKNVASGPPPELLMKYANALKQVVVSQSVIENAKMSARTETSVPGILSDVKDAAQRLSVVAGQMGDSSTSSTLSGQTQSLSQQMTADGVGGIPWLTVLGVGAGVVALYFVWKHYSGKKQIASFEYDEPEAKKPMFQGLGRHRLSSMGSCKSPKRKRLSSFEPESRLEGHSGSRRRSHK